MPFLGTPQEFRHLEFAFALLSSPSFRPSCGVAGENALSLQIMVSHLAACVCMEVGSFAVKSENGSEFDALQMYFLTSAARKCHSSKVAHSHMHFDALHVFPSLHAWFQKKATGGTEQWRRQIMAIRTGMAQSWYCWLTKSCGTVLVHIVFMQNCSVEGLWKMYVHPTLSLRRYLGIVWTTTASALAGTVASWAVHSCMCLLSSLQKKKKFETVHIDQLAVFLLCYAYDQPEKCHTECNRIPFSTPLARSYVWLCGPEVDMVYRWSYQYSCMQLHADKRRRVLSHIVESVFYHLR